MIPAGCEAPHGHYWKRETCARMVECIFEYSNLFAMSNNRLLIFDFVAGPGAWHLETKYSSVNVQKASSMASFAVLVILPSLGTSSSAHTLK